MLKKSTLRTFPNLLLQSARIATTRVVLKRVKPLCAILLCSLLLLSVGLGAPVARPQVTLLTRVLDDFTTGLPDNAPWVVWSGSRLETQQGNPNHLVGGFRRLLFNINTPVLGQPGILDIRPGNSEHGFLVVDTGYKTFGGAQLIYGFDDQGRANPLNLNLCLYDRFRLHFDGNDVPMGVVIVVFTNGGRGRAQGQVQLLANTNERDVDLTFDSFTAAQPLPEQPNWGDVDAIVLELNTASAVGGNDFAIHSFTAVCVNPIACAATCLQ